MNRVEQELNRLGFTLLDWRVRAVLWVVLGALAFVAAWVVHPDPLGSEQSYVGSLPFGEPCAWQEAHGMPCPNCGMTRSWIYSARGHLWRGWTYNPAGATLFLTLVGGGVFSTVRLLARRMVLPLSPWVWLGGPVAWLLLYATSWGLRLQGVNPLP